MTPSLDPQVAIRTSGLVKSFGDHRVVDNVDLEVRRGEIFGVLGPNGAGKTTMLRMLATLLPIDDRPAEVFGVDVRTEPHVVRQLVGVTGQYASVDENLTAQENFWLFGRCRGSPPGRPSPPPATCSAGSPSRTRPSGRSRRSPAACAGASTSPPA